MTALAMHHQVQNETSARRETRLSGRGYVPAADCSYPPAIEAGDVLEVDFDCDRVANDGLYLAEIVENGRCVWRGCRRFSRVPGGVRMDSTGVGTWDAAPAGLRIVGRVARIFGPK